MICEEMLDDRVLHWSDQDLWIVQVETGKLYESALDLIPCPYTYEETDMPIVEEEEQVVVSEEEDDGELDD